MYNLVCSPLSLVCVGVWLHAIVSGLMVFLADTVLKGNLEVSFLVALTFAVHPVSVYAFVNILFAYVCATFSSFQFVFFFWASQVKVSIHFNHICDIYIYI